MPNLKGGNKHRKGKKNDGVKSNKIELKDPDRPCDYYAKVQKSHGDGRFGVKLVDASGRNFVEDGGGDFVAVVPGRMKKGNRAMNWVNMHDYLLVTRRDPQSTTCRIMEIVLKYQPQAVSQLLKLGLIPSDESFEFSLEDLNGTIASSSGTTDRDDAAESQDWNDKFEDI